ncbi:MAG: methyltransferase domain-containing protein, partial [Gammaproteobacteria bacterium]|nr:methyltransferase domain-containing protein [Gammaproteobacteria bacterium]MDH5730020.1 methyltransferase domain-containing protein [Gammaproteobacteria bacterium]
MGTNAQLGHAMDMRVIEENPNLRTNTLYVHQTPQRRFAIYHHSVHGKMLYFDEYCHSAEDDEYIYHESIIHPALLAHPHPQRVLLLGGGHGAGLREILKHPDIEKVIVLDQDGDFIDACERFLPEWHQGVFDDPRVEFVIGDMSAFFHQFSMPFDIVVYDQIELLSSMSVESFSKLLQKIKIRMHPGGSFVMKSFPFSVSDNERHLNLLSLVKAHFKFIDTGRVFVPSSTNIKTCICASDACHVAKLPKEIVNRRLDRRNIESKLKFYDGDAHNHVFALSKDLRKLLV